MENEILLSPHFSSPISFVSLFIQLFYVLKQNNYNDILRNELMIADLKLVT